MRSRTRHFEVYSLSAIDLFASAMGAFIIISIMLLVNAGLDFFQEHRALNALKSLKQRLKAETIVLRDGEFKTIPARELVPGDIIKLRIAESGSTYLVDGNGRVLYHSDAERIGEDFDRACSLCLACSGRIVVTGMGKSGHIAGKIAATLASTGTPAAKAMTSRSPS